MGRHLISLKFVQVYPLPWLNTCPYNSNIICVTGHMSFLTKPYSAHCQYQMQTRKQEVDHRSTATSRLHSRTGCGVFKTWFKRVRQL